MYWGFSEALNLYENYMKYCSKDENVDEINILLYGSGDPRHILKTISKSFKFTTKINFFIAEGCIDIIARNMLLIGIALEDASVISIKGKTQLFMDIFGNSCLRPSSFNYLRSKAKFLIKMITDYEWAAEMAPNFNLDFFKYRERDFLENIFKFWSDNKILFDIKKQWENRMRSTLGTRYDHRMGVFDWDLEMNLKHNGAKQICSQEYRHWRETGVAFVFPEYEQSIPNKTLALTIVREGNHFKKWQYVGEMTIGPFISFGCQCEDDKMKFSIHGINDFRATDVTERNIFEIMYEIQERKDYTHDIKNCHRYGGAVLDNGTIHASDNLEQGDVKEFNKQMQKLDNVSIKFLSVDELLKIQHNRNMQRKFDIVFVANNYFPLINEDFKNIFNENSLIIFETKQMTALRMEKITEFQMEIRKFCEKLKLKLITNLSINQAYSVLTYKYTVQEN